MLCTRWFFKVPENKPAKQKLFGLLSHIFAVNKMLIEKDLRLGLKEANVSLGREEPVRWRWGEAQQRKNSTELEQCGKDVTSCVHRVHTHKCWMDVVAAVNVISYILWPTVRSVSDLGLTKESSWQLYKVGWVFLDCKRWCWNTWLWLRKEQKLQR